MTQVEDSLSCVCEGKNVDCNYCDGRGQIPLVNHISILYNLREKNYYKTLNESERFNVYKICLLRDDFLPQTITVTIRTYNRETSKIKTLNSFGLNLRTSYGLVDYSIGYTFKYLLDTLHMLKGSGVMKGKFQFEIIYNDEVESFNNNSKGYNLDLDERLLFIEYLNLFRRKVKIH
jgi:hypothetical protein